MSIYIKIGSINYFVPASADKSMSCCVKPKSKKFKKNYVLSVPKCKYNYVELVDDEIAYDIMATTKIKK